MEMTHEQQAAAAKFFRMVSEHSLAIAQLLESNKVKLAKAKAETSIRQLERAQDEMCDALEAFQK